MYMYQVILAISHVCSEAIHKLNAFQTTSLTPLTGDIIMTCDNHPGPNQNMPYKELLPRKWIYYLWHIILYCVLHISLEDIQYL